jgi:hypothetical protein
MPLPPPLQPLWLLLLASAAAGFASALSPSVPLHFALCGPDNMGIRAIRLNQWPGWFGYQVV